MTFREELYDRITDTDFGDEEDVFLLVQSLAGDLLRYHDVCIEYEKTLTELMSTKAYTEWVTESAQKIFIQEMERMPDSYFKDFVLKNLPEIFGKGEEES